MKLKTIKDSSRSDKRFMAVFEVDGKEKTIHFGQKGANTYIDNASDDTRKNYLARHRVNEDWSKPDTPGSLASHILWGDHKSMRENIAAFKKKFKV